MISTSPRTPEVRTATVLGRFSRNPHAVAGTPRFRSLTPAAACGCEAQFLAPSNVEEAGPAHRASNRGEVAMNRLRYPFIVDRQ
ncbi:hypothetical protein E1211_06380 [Micromonospora sp. 15K316]|uniref:hypothetical protein n=1 Tax=Micromonospora sp. 15K316 TaxID=2530376 RepID=UPI001042F2EF|nr:hypothetical protein [Micromonospora sp. 15K316]TDC38665.1 hypothetical protein E1211_06380 [Micromonospora sp. 15K316]